MNDHKMTMTNQITTVTQNRRMAMRNRSQNERLAYEICCMSVWATICGWELANELTNQITTATQNRRMDKSDGNDKSVVYIPTQFGSRRLGLYSKRLVLIGVS